MVGIFRASCPGDSVSSNPEKTVPRIGRRWGWWGGVSLYRSLPRGAGSLNIKRLLLMKENQKPHIKKFSTFLNRGNYMTCHEIKRRLLLGRKVITNLDSIFKTRDIICQQRSV